LNDVIANCIKPIKVRIIDAPQSIIMASIAIDIPGLFVVGWSMYGLINKMVTDPMPHGMIT
jgi:hypothetical protein